jgi:hypothetical protein
MILTEKKKPNGCMITIFVIVGLMVFFGIIGALVGDDSKPERMATTSPTEVKTESRDDLELIKHGSERGEFGNLYITGTIKNNTNKQYKYVQVEVNLYDDDGAQIGSTLANTNNLEPRGMWKFKAVAMEDNAASYRIKDITGY